MALGEPGHRGQPLGGSKICVICLVLYPLTSCLCSQGQSLQAGETRGKQETHLQSGGETDTHRLSLLRVRATGWEHLWQWQHQCHSHGNATMMWPLAGASFTQADKEGWDCWVSHSGVLGMDIKSVGSPWPCGFCSFWAGICTSQRSCWVDGICNHFIFPGLKILCKLGFYFPFLTAEPRSGGNECVIPLWKHLNRWKGQGRIEREGGEPGFRQKSCFLSKNRLKAFR